jgi:hypothetical protein
VVVSLSREKKEQVVHRVEEREERGGAENAWERETDSHENLRNESAVVDI